MKTLRSLKCWFKVMVFVLIYLGCFPCLGYSQQKALNIAGIHQLVDASKSEYDLQVEARNRQTVTTANEQQNKIMLARLKMKYRELQQRYNSLANAINAANIGIQATPMVNRIVQNQIEIYRLAQQNPSLIDMAYRTEIEFVEKCRSLVNYLVGLSASFGAVNQMKASDRKILFDYVLFELSGIQELSAGLLNSMQFSNTAGMLRSLNPFQNYVDQDKQLVGEIISNAKFLK